MLTPQQLEHLKQLIDNKINIFIAQNISGDHFTPEEIKALRNAGVQVELIKPSERLIYQSFAFGLISNAIPKSTLNATTYEAFKKFLNSKDFLPLNSYERGVISSLERQSMADIKGIGSRYKKTLEDAVISSERQYYEDILRRNILEGKAKKESLRVISNNISKELDDFGRSFDKAVQTISHNAYTEGREAFIQRNYGEDANFWVEVYSGACSWCIQSYLTAGLGSEPKVFKIGSLPPSNINYGKKKSDWIVTKPSSHPYCRCDMKPVPQGYIWDEQSQSFVPSSERKVERKSKVKITFGDKEYEI